MTVTEAPREVREVHSAYTIYGRERNGTRSKSPLATFHRPQDWGDPRWTYHLFRFEWVTGPDNTHYINNAHCWTDMPGVATHEFPALFASLFTMIALPGQRAELCGRSHLDPDEFWEKSWGPQPPWYEGDDEDDFDPFGGEAWR